MKQILSFVIGALCIGILLASCTKASSNTVTLGNTDTTASSSGSGSQFAAGTVFTFAGNGNQGFVDATGTSAEFGSPKAITVDKLGNVYVVDGLNYAIRVITPEGVVSTLAGNGTSGYVDGQGTSAEFEAPQGIAVDESGNVYVSEGNLDNNQRIRKITPSGYVTTLAGTGVKGFLNSTFGLAEFYGPGPMAFDQSGFLYVGDMINERIRKLEGEGALSLVTTFAGNGKQGDVNGPASSAEFNIPGGIAFDPSGNLYVADTYNFSIRKITPSGTVSDFAGSKINSGYLNGTGTGAEFSNPVAIASDSLGNLYVSEGSINNCIRKITPAGVVTTLTGTQAAGFADGNLGTAIFNNPAAIAIGPKGNLFVADAWNYRIRKIILY
jgi:sugar lactone lactonase YvrE